MRHLPLVLLAAWVALAAPAAAQPVIPGQRPTREAGRRPAGTASIGGRVLTADTGRPLVGARVTLLSASQQEGFSALTDQDGRYLITSLPAGTYTVTASKTGFASLAHGASGPQRPGRRVPLSQGQAVRDIDLRLPRGSVITGRVYDDTGEPIVRAMVRALRYMYVQGERRLSQAGTGESDDRGMFRVYGLLPGTYIVAAVARNEGGPPESVEPGAGPVSYAPTYYPGVAAVTDASPLVVSLQQEVGNVDFLLQLVTTARVAGVVTSEAGPVGGTSVVLVPDDPWGGGGMAAYGTRVMEDGTFSIRAVPPGRYLAVARSSPLGGRRVVGTPLMGIQPVNVAGTDVSGVAIALSEGAVVSGTIATDADTGQRAPELGQIRVISETPQLAMLGGAAGGGAARVAADGTFSLTNAYSLPFFLRVTGLPADWALKGIYVDGRDVTESPLEVRPGQPISGVQVLLTGKPTEISGTVIDRAGRPMTEGWVVAFATDPAAWRPRSRRVQGVRPGADGLYHLRGLPPGSYYLAVAPDLEAGAWYDPALLDELQKSATRVTIGEGETRTQELRPPSGPSPS